MIVYGRIEELVAYQYKKKQICLYRYKIKMDKYLTNCVIMRREGILTVKTGRQGLEEFPYDRTRTSRAHVRNQSNGYLSKSKDHTL